MDNYLAGLCLVATGVFLLCCLLANLNRRLEKLEKRLQSQQVEVFFDWLEDLNRSHISTNGVDHGIFG